MILALLWLVLLSACAGFGFMGFLSGKAFGFSPLVVTAMVLAVACMGLTLVVEGVQLSLLMLAAWPVGAIAGSIHRKLV